VSLKDRREGSFEMTDEEVGKHLIDCERALLDPAVRRDRAQVEALLAKEFLEFGSSGLVWNRPAIVELLATEAYTAPAAEAMQCARIAAEVALVTYRTVRTDAETGKPSVTLRSSLWIWEAGRWRVRFHQGTRVP
jgi:ribonuclease HI